MLPYSRNAFLSFFGAGFGRIKLISCLFIIALLVSCGSPQVNKNQVETIISQIQQNYAPDARTALFEVDYSVKADSVLLTGETTEEDAIGHLTMRLSVQNIPAINKVTVLPERELGGKVFGLINNSVANIRSRPSHTSQLITQATLGTPVTVYKAHESEGWFYIQTPDNYLGWVDEGGLARMDSSAYSSWKQSDKVIFTAAHGVVYESPAPSSYPVSDLVMGAILRSTGGESNEHLKVIYPDGRSGYLHKEQAREYGKWHRQSSDVSASDLIHTARGFKGFPYIWGGTSAKAFDCSGFTQTVFFMNGIQIPRDASQQVMVGDTVKAGDSYQGVQAGDLLFFGEQEGRITHVALYMGDSEIIHASGKVKIESLSPTDEHYTEHRDTTFQEARRILGSLDSGKIKQLKKNNYY